jgi:hypothetical protein
MNVNVLSSGGCFPAVNPGLEYVLPFSGTKPKRDEKPQVLTTELKASTDRTRSCHTKLPCAYNKSEHTELPIMSSCPVCEALLEI